MKKRLPLIALALVATTWGLLMPATAHDKAIVDSDDSAGQLDIARVDVIHENERLEVGVVRFVFTFYEPHGFADLPRADMRINLDLFKGAKRDRYVMVYANPDGGMYGELFNLGRVIGYARAWAPSDDQIAVELRMRQLSAGELPARVNWHASTSYENESCGEGGDVVGYCSDSTPEPPQRSHRHRFDQ